MNETQEGKVSLLKPVPAGKALKPSAALADQRALVDTKGLLPQNKGPIPCPEFPRTCPFGGACHTCPTHLQAKLTISQPGDAYEREADQVAETVMRMPGQKAEKVRDATVQAARDPSGQPLAAGTRATMEAGFHHDFSRVRIHADRQAAESAQAINARAYTIGSDVVFAAGQYAPETETGQRLIAHELAHVVQQNPPTLISRQTPDASETKPEAEPVTPKPVHPLNGSGSYRRGIQSGHDGVDLAAAKGTKVVAVLSGSVKRFGTGCSDVGKEGQDKDRTCGGGYGNFVFIDHGEEGQTRYAHLTDVSVSKVGDSVSQGQEIGTVGDTGRSSGAHLHFEWRDKSGMVTDPCQKIENMCPEKK